MHPSKDRVFHLAVHMGWVDFDLGCSVHAKFCPSCGGIWQKWLGGWTTWWNIKIKVNPTQVHDEMRHPEVRSLMADAIADGGPEPDVLPNGDT